MFITTRVISVRASNTWESSMHGMNSHETI